MWKPNCNSTFEVTFIIKSMGYIIYVLCMGLNDIVLLILVLIISWSMENISAAYQNFKKPRRLFPYVLNKIIEHFTINDFFYEDYL